MISICNDCRYGRFILGSASAFLTDRIMCTHTDAPHYNINVRDLEMAGAFVCKQYWSRARNTPEPQPIYKKIRGPRQVRKL